tara:strand:+ start:1450 stop:2316 length:867 start_codon:yes stop_codon:yes gene_type:complete
MCSGAVVDLQYIITNYHCIHDQKYIKIYFWNKEDWNDYDVEVIGTDPLGDLVLLKAVDKDEPVPELKFSNEEIKSGQDVFALGHPMGMVWSVSRGVISHEDRYARHPYIHSIQTDAAINVGNSGGPLLNMKGEIVGINTFIISKVKESAGIGIAIRNDTVQKSFKTMLEKGKVDRPAIGIMVVGLGTSDIQRTKLYKDNPSAKPGQIPNTFGMLIQKSDNMPENIKEFDTLFAIDDKLFNTHVEMSNILEEYNVGDTVTLSIIRNRKFIKLDISLKVFEVPVEKMYKR